MAQTTLSQIGNYNHSVAVWAILSALPIGIFGCKRSEFGVKRDFASIQNETNQVSRILEAFGIFEDDLKYRSNNGNGESRFRCGEDKYITAKYKNNELYYVCFAGAWTEFRGSKDKRGVRDNLAAAFELSAHTRVWKYHPPTFVVEPSANFSTGKGSCQYSFEDKVAKKAGKIVFDDERWVITMIEISRIK